MNQVIEAVIELADIPDAERIVLHILEVNTGHRLTEQTDVPPILPPPEIVESWLSANHRRRFRLRIPGEMTENSLPSLLMILCGEATLMFDYRLVDLKLPDSFGWGPAYGIEGLRRRLNIKKRRPLLMAILKPTWNLNLQERAEWIRRLAIAGIDIIKEDEMTHDTPVLPLIDRISLAREVIMKVQDDTGRRILFVPAFFPSRTPVHKRWEELAGAGAEALLIQGWVWGMGVVETLRQLEPTPLLFLHPTFSGLLDHRDKGIARHLLWGHLSACSGVDAVLYPSRFGTFPVFREDEERILNALRARGVWPVPGGGLSPDRMEAMSEYYGPDVIYNFGSRLMSHPEGPEQVIKILREKLDRLYS